MAPRTPKHYSLEKCALNSTADKAIGTSNLSPQVKVVRPFKTSCHLPNAKGPIFSQRNMEYQT